MDYRILSDEVKRYIEGLERWQNEQVLVARL
jgi:hypothetical protein